MDFGWSTEDSELYEKARSFAERELNSTLEQREISHEFGRTEWNKCGGFGLLGAPVATRYGGLGLGCLATARLFEAFGRGCRDGGLGFSAGAHSFACCLPLLHHGSEAAQDEFLPRLARGEWIGANAITETEAGSDVSAMASVAKKTDGEYRISGAKIFVTNGPLANVFIVYASTQPNHGYFGLSAFVLPRDTPGLTVGKAFRKMGLTTSPMCPVYFDDCPVKESQRLGAEGQGGPIFNNSMAWERTCLFAFWLGTMERQLGLVIAQACNRKQFGAPIGANQAVAHPIADMKLRLESARLLLYRACWEMDAGQPSPISISLAKLAISEAAVRAGIDSIQIFGGSGVLPEMGIERMLRDTVPGKIYSGTSEIHRDIVAQHLGIPVNFWRRSASLLARRAKKPRKD